MMDHLIWRLFAKYILVPAAVVLLLVIMLAATLIWDKIKTKWQERNLK